VLARSTHAALLVALVAITVVPRAAARPTDPVASKVDDATRERSRAAFRRGVVQLRAQDWTGARASFEEAWSLVQHPSILLNLGIARLHTEAPVLAEQDLVRFLSEDPDAAAEEQAAARAALAEARARIGTLRVVATPPGARILVDGRPLAVRSLPAERSTSPQAVAEGRFESGAHAVRVEADGFVAHARKVDVKAKSETELEISLAAEPPPRSPAAASARTSARRIVGWSLAATSGAALVASGALGLRAISLAGDYGDRASDSFQRADVKSEGVAFRTGADVALVAALVAGAGAVVLLFTDVGASTPSPSARAPALLRW
jgi:hypothetical protein